MNHQKPCCEDCGTPIGDCDCDAQDPEICVLCGDPVIHPLYDCGSGPEHMDCHYDAAAAGGDHDTHSPVTGDPATDGVEVRTVGLLVPPAPAELACLQALVRAAGQALDAGDLAEVARLVRAAGEVTR